MNREYFEGWYFKQQTAEGKTLALIPGVAQDGAFLQVVTGQGSYNVPFPQEDYHRANPAWLGENRFSLAGVKLNVAHESLRLKGLLRFSHLVPLGYDIMGPLAALPLQDHHAVLSMNHRLQGTIWLNGQQMDFTGGRGYIEGDRGSSFPDRYTWAHCNYFPFDASVMLAAARIPAGPLHFWGCTAVVWLNGRQYRIASYLGAKISIRERCFLQLKQGDAVLSVGTQNTKGHALAAPHHGGMVRTIHESPSTGAHFRFEKNGKVLLDAESGFASYEFVD